MNYSQNLWNLCCISLQNNKGYDFLPLSVAKQWIQLGKLKASTKISDDLLVFLHNSKKSVRERGSAGLCLRCYVSYPILNACQHLANLFSANKNFTYSDLLSFVLNDDGQDLILMDEQGQQFNLDKNDTLIQRSFHIFSVEILYSYQYQKSSKLSLKNWAFLKAKQNKEVRKFLAEFGFQHLTDWALLNRARKTQAEKLSEPDQQLLTVYHQVYRRDRRTQAQPNQQLQTTQRTKCQTPTSAQLEEMLEKLQSKGLEIIDSQQILLNLHRLAEQLRQYDIWQSRESLEHYDSESGDYQLRKDLPNTSLDEDHLEEEEMIQLLQQSLAIALDNNLASVLQEKQNQLAKSKRYRKFAGKFLEGLRLYYLEAQSLKEIAPQLGMNSWSQARRILDPGNLLTQVRSLTLEQLLDKLIKLAQSKGIIDRSPNPNYLSKLCQQLEIYVDTEIFAAAAAEIQTGKNRSLNSPYAQKLKEYLQQN